MSSGIKFGLFLFIQKFSIPNSPNMIEKLSLSEIPERLY